MPVGERNQVDVPLSEDEQRILSEIEQQLYESDPALAREVGSTTVYTAAFRATGLQASLNWYRNATSAAHGAWARQFAGQTIDIPACFIAGAQDWGVWQAPGALETMEGASCADYRGTTLIDGAGHWVQQEQPGDVVAALNRFHGAL